MRGLVFVVSTIRVHKGGNMSDTSQGPGWWLASDGRWYPPEAKPGVPLPPPPLNVSNHPGVPLSSKLTGWTVGLMWAIVAFDILVAAAAMSYRSALSGTSLTEAVEAEELYMNATGIAVLLWITTFVLLIVWLAKAHTSSTSLLTNPRSRNYSQGWCIGVWFIPFANIFSTPRVFAEHQRIATAPRSNGRAHHEWAKQPLDPRLILWWVLTLAGLVVIQFGADSLTFEASLGEYQDGLVAMVVGSLLTAAGIASGALFLRSVGAALADVSTGTTSNPTAREGSPYAAPADVSGFQLADRPNLLSDPPTASPKRLRPMLPTQPTQSDVSDAEQ